MPKVSVYNIEGKKVSDIDLKEEIFDEQRDYYNTLVSKGWYKVETQPTSKIHQELMKLQSSKNELNNYYLGE